MVVIGVASAAYVGVVQRGGEIVGTLFLYEEEWRTRTGRLFAQREKRNATVDWRFLEEPGEYTTWGTLTRPLLERLASDSVFVAEDGDYVVLDISEPAERREALLKFISSQEMERYQLVPRLVDFCDIVGDRVR